MYKKSFLYLILLLNQIVFTNSSLSLPIHYVTNPQQNIPFLSFVQIFPLKINQYRMPAITMSIGTPPQSFEFLITTYSSKMYIPKHNGFDCEASSTCEDSGKEIPLRFIGEKTKGRLVKDIVTVEQVTVNKFNFVNIIDDDITYIYKGMIGFDYLCLNEDRDIQNPVRYSFLSEIYGRGYIEKQMFSVGKIEGAPKIILGGVPENDLSFRKFKKCKLIQRKSDGSYSNLWKCTLNSIYFDDYTMYPVNEPIAFGISSNFMSVTLDFFNFLKDKYFKKPIEEGVCRVNIDENSRALFCLNDFDTSYIGTISLVIGKINIKLSGEQLWISNSRLREKYLSLMYYEEKKFTWSINYNIIQNQYTMVFNRQDDVFGLLVN